MSNILPAVQWIGGGFCLLLGVMYRDLKAQVLDVTQANVSHKLHVAENYVTKDDLTKAIEAINKSIDAFIAQQQATAAKLDRLIERQQ